ncbi:6,7-dimethyl-8-ribityllumazine synthase [Ornithobacterium rhinotracheale]|uniref:6,7-dimethyl-8-ribityllumazine synthase n=2 Tax=Ornithobacterium rhinotracheale TaxID=28251 RepID=I3ZZN8_ORNRL|nr:6,7-dimethyl-8-ribityllumazine synthase [Ornithobacterium rhinotracheale]AFL97172.1 6,7-dimethyl-8-ribityllumazine synthase [Ornithobacterium rhinotracheale DSM 15997]AIP99264.1 6,7-dimethyl-8-ribityllumazine synthase [Ornithobacterium rhinotracheale ORT-UMN 88]KGB67118.1 6,7-dimethyl-8-ribityllumazine synthase [Ornithobacterium rhinotracheale H06-030791]MBN3662363.1 6,7-dimethyl-8-ribityllumazine synthase [Ornithobacterium rhinotracheale]MCK0194304.1 6,7-dimethyl-8-ribityllumazine synthase
MATENKNLSQYNKEELPSAKPYKFGIVVSSWNSEITHALRDGAIETLKDLGASDKNIKTLEVPGSFELPYGAKLLTKYCDAIIVIGSVIRGETAHFDFVCQGVTQGIMQLNVSQNTPVIFCVLTDNNIEQSRNRAGGKHGNKGVEAAVAALQMADIRNQRGL